MPAKPSIVVRASILVVVVLAVAAGAVAMYTTVNGPWGAQDSVAYIVSARNLMQGRGLGITVPDGTIRLLTQFPPVFPVVLSAIGLLGSELVAASRWLNIVLFALSILLAGAILIRHTSAPDLSIPACLLLAAFPTTVKMFASSLSEPLFLCLLLLAVFCLLESSKSSKARWLVLSAVFTGLVPLTRYVGVALIPVMAAGVLVTLPGTRRHRARKAALFGVVTSLPILIWGALAFLGGSHEPGPWELRLDWSYISSQANDFSYSVMQFVPLWLPFGNNLLGVRLRYLYGGFAIAFTGIAVLALAANRQLARTDPLQAHRREIAVFGLSWLWVVAYFSVMALANLTTAPLPPAISNRMLLPVYIGLVLAFTAGFSVVQGAWFAGRWRWLRGVPWAIALWGLVYYVPQTFNDIVVPLHAGSGPTSYQWRDSPTMAAARHVPADVAIVSNEPLAIEVWAERPAIQMIESLPPSFIGEQTPYGASQSDPAQVAFREHRAALVIFEDELPRQLQDAFDEAGLARLETIFNGLVFGRRLADGVVYYSP